MNKRKNISAVFKILGLYEDAKSENSVVAESDYLAYVRRMVTMYHGLECEEFYGLLNGVYKKGIAIDHSELKAIIFHIINELNREDGANGASVL